MATGDSLIMYTLKRFTVPMPASGAFFCPSYLPYSSLPAAVPTIRSMASLKQLSFLVYLPYHPNPAAVGSAYLYVPLSTLRPISRLAHIRHGFETLLDF